MLDSRLISLLASERSDPLVAACHECVTAHPDIGCLHLDALPASHVVGIYTVRARGNEKRKGGIEGFERLVRAFNGPLPSKMAIYELGALPPNHFMVFTDEGLTRLLGVLRFPTKLNEDAV